jgi:hypothetical protein
MDYNPPLPNYIDLKQLFKGNIGCINSKHANRYALDDQGNRIVHFSGEDKPELFENNLDKQPADWHYRHKQVTYRCNSRFYRCAEWDTVDWASSVVLFGCSQVQGQGLAEDETISEQLAQLLGRPVINLGVGGSGMMYNLHNSLLLMKNFPTPWAVVQQWPNADRIHVFSDYLMTMGPWDPGQHPLFMAWNQDASNAQLQAIFVKEMSETLWKNRTRYYSLTQSWHTAQAINCDWVERVDFARDLAHPGPLTAAAAVRYIAERLS